MKAFSFKFLTHIYIIINIFIFIKCQDEDNENNKPLEIETENITCKKLIIYKNGTLSNKTINEDKSKNNTIISIQSNKYFVIYDCLKNITDNDCTSYNNNNSDESLSLSFSPHYCINKNTKGDKDNICCYYRENNSMGNISVGCLEVNQYEIHKFIRTFQDNNFENKNYNESIIEIECNDKINKTNKFIILFFLILFINL